jgi:hypothetical protein
MRLFGHHTLTFTYFAVAFAQFCFANFFCCALKFSKLVIVLDFISVRQECLTHQTLIAAAREWRSKSVCCWCFRWYCLLWLRQINSTLLKRLQNLLRYVIDWFYCNVTHTKGFKESKAVSVYSGATENPLAVTQDAFSTMYTDNIDLWGDLKPDEAYINYVRTQTGNVDSARSQKHSFYFINTIERLLLEFGMVPSVKGSGSKLHNAAAKGSVKEVTELLEQSSRCAALRICN